MLRGYWRIIIAIAGLACLGLLSAGYYQLESAEKQPYPKTEYQPARDARLPVPMEKGEIATSAYQPNCQAPQSKDDADLCAQWGAVQATSEANRLSRIGLRVTYFEFGALIVSLIFTGWAAVAAGKAATSAAHANELSDNSDKRRDRAYLLASPLGIWNLIGRRECIGHVMLKNVGSTPAFNVSLKVKADISDDKDRRDFDYPPDPKRVQRALQPDAQMAQGSMKPFLPMQNMNEGGHYIYVWGVTYYDDIFGERHFTKFCFRYDTGSRDQVAFRDVWRTGDSGFPKSFVIIESEKARHHLHGNDAD